MYDIIIALIYRCNTEKERCVKMKTVKKIAAIFMLCVMLVSICIISSSASENSFNVSMMNFNVAGLPTFDGTDSAGNHEKIAEYIVANNFDIVAVQEDFAYNKSLVSNLTGYEYKTNHSGSIPGGDGLNIFTDGMPLYNETRVQWNDSFGDIAEGDILTPKGIIYAVIEVAEGVYIDFYNIHADAFDTEGSIAARESNYTQLMSMVEANSAKNNRPVIITGDFNSSLHMTDIGNSNMYSIFQEKGGVNDAWIEIHNNGDYFGFSSWNHEGDSYWGEWDSVEKFLYRDGGGVTVEPVDFRYSWVTNDAGERVSDHASAECVFEFTVTEDFVANTQELAVVEQSPLRNFFNTIKWIIKDLIYFFSHMEELIAFLG